MASMNAVLLELISHDAYKKSFYHVQVCRWGTGTFSSRIFAWVLIGDISLSGCTSILRKDV
jgi:hypothetical protein